MRTARLNNDSIPLLFTHVNSNKGEDNGKFLVDSLDVVYNKFND